MSAAPGQECGRRALSALDTVLARKPQRDDDKLSEATADLTKFRDAIIAERRGGGIQSAEERQHLAHLNAVLSVVLGVHFPLGETPWDELQRARSWLSDLVKEA
ncbi:hypothetical protein GOFOIKOB_5829 [Methylobacterium tardum]|uniref:Uncharacterized protein n=1 Tax=Methylobacterium tardum TaxID=374432 RepID=A0AA37T712_9HYPH|nr:hypothetical protein [Methylobacterium tardum]URD39506.1 hypothetical protein M6G65_14520 [Methylobacterium tardum]GJE52755.1 hypothetical protein GOFOIKOB_5829 [Methylobacterium tardum]GLS68249.1 hypothetical protein GCM10007890_02610 [Methylobacterium tardum]